MLEVLPDCLAGFITMAPSLAAALKALPRRRNSFCSLQIWEQDGYFVQEDLARSFKGRIVLLPTDALLQAFLGRLSAWTSHTLCKYRLA